MITKKKIVDIDTLVRKLGYRPEKVHALVHVGRTDTYLFINFPGNPNKSPVTYSMSDICKAYNCQKVELGLVDYYSHVYNDEVKREQVLVLFYDKEI